jgi:hypothetical protein
MRGGEDDMVVIARQKPSLLAGQPALDLEPGALRAHPVPTGVVPDPFQMPLRARLDLTTEYGRATRQERPHGSTHIVR